MYEVGGESGGNHTQDCLMQYEIVMVVVYSRVYRVVFFKSSVSRAVYQL